MGADGKMDVHLDVSTVGYAGRLEVLEGPTGRRVRTEADKARIVAESLTPGAVVTEIARRADICPGQIYRWRREVRAWDETIESVEKNQDWVKNATIESRWHMLREQ